MTSSILVVDDEPELERLIKQRFSDEIDDGIYEFHFALSGAEALEHISKNSSIDVVVTDLNMPGIGGFELLERITKVGRSCKVLIVSAYGSSYNMSRAKELGAKEFFTKPINFKLLKQTIEACIESSASL